MAPSTLFVPDSRGRGFIKLEPYRGEEFWITARFEGASVRWRSYACSLCDGLPEFFEWMAREKAGWKGARKWNTGVSGFALKASNDGRSDVDLRIEFEPRATEDGAGFKAVFTIAPDELDRIAVAVRKVLQKSMHARHS
jgi:hypothetical protein